VIVVVRIMLALSFFLTMNIGVRAGEANDFTIRSGDVLQVTVWKEDGMDRELVVLPDGTITFPLVGTVVVQDLTAVAAQDLIKDKLIKFIPDAAVTVMVKAPLGHTVNVLGQVVKPGEIVMGRRMTVLQVISQAGGLTPYASESSIVILRNLKGEKTSIEYPYDDIVRGRHLEQDVDLVPGDVIVVPTAGLF